MGSEYSVDRGPTAGGPCWLRAYAVRSDNNRFHGGMRVSLELLVGRKRECDRLRLVGKDVGVRFAVSESVCTVVTRGRWTQSEPQQRTKRINTQLDMDHQQTAFGEGNGAVDPEAVTRAIRAHGVRSARTYSGVFAGMLGSNSRV